MKLIALLLGSVTVIGSGLLSHVVAQPMDAVVLITVKVVDPVTHAEKVLTQGSGFLIDRQGHILTAKHVLQVKQAEEPGPRKYVVALRHRQAAPVNSQLVACDSDQIDMCLIKIDDAAVSAANITEVFSPVCRPLQVDESIIALGFPFGGANPVIKVSGDVVGAVASELKYPSNVQIVPGMSGGPVIDRNGYAVAMNAGGATGYPTLTFLQPLYYGIGLIARSGTPCLSGTTPAARTLPLPPPPPPPAQTAACSSREMVIRRTQNSQNEPAPTTREYVDSIQPDTGCRIAAITQVIRSQNNSSGVSWQIAPDGVAARISYDLTSGPFFDRYRGWIDTTLSIEQRPR